MNATSRRQQSWTEAVWGSQLQQGSVFNQSNSPKSKHTTNIKRSSDLIPKWVIGIKSKTIKYTQIWRSQKTLKFSVCTKTQFCEDKLDQGCAHGISPQELLQNSWKRFYLSRELFLAASNTAKAQNPLYWKLEFTSILALEGHERQILGFISFT